ncbi:MAG: S-layer homology domain-containing protein [Eubacteriales bacterium]
MTREDLINMLHRTVAFPLDPTNSSRFSDTTINDTALNWAAEKGIINGFPDGTARPDTEITRQEALVIIARFLGAYKIEYPDAVSDSILESFSDVDDIDNWARDNIGVIVRYGIVRGTPSVNGPAINPLRSVTQEEMIALLGRMIEVCY